MKQEEIQPIELELARNKEILENRKMRFRMGWQQLIHDRGPFIAFVTLKFQRYYTDRQSINAANQFFRCLNGLAFGRRWLKKGKCFSGVVIAEQNKARASLAGGLHFHILLQPNEFIESKAALPELDHIAVVAAKRLKDPSDRAMCSISNPNAPVDDMSETSSLGYSAEGVVTKEIGNEAKLVSYLTKEIDDPSCESGDQVLLLGLHGLDSCCLDRWRKTAH